MLLYLCHISASMLTAPPMQAAALLTPARRERLARLKAPADRARCLIGGLMLRRFADIESDSCLNFGPHGKPYAAAAESSPLPALSSLHSLSALSSQSSLSAPSSPLSLSALSASRSGSGAPLHFNLSHAGSCVLLGVDPEYEIGVDVELPRPLRREVCRLVCTGEETEWLRARNMVRLQAEAAGADAGLFAAQDGPAGDGQVDGSMKDFLTLWTAKEAVMKAVGEGFAMGAASFSVLPVIDGPHLIPVRSRRQPFLLQWFYRGSAVLCAACMTSASSGFPCRLQELSSEQLLEQSGLL